MTLSVTWWVPAAFVAWFVYLTLRTLYASRRGTLVSDGNFIIHKKQYPNKWSKDIVVCRVEHYIPDIIARTQEGDVSTKGLRT